MGFRHAQYGEQPGCRSDEVRHAFRQQGLDQAEAFPEHLGHCPKNLSPIGTEVVCTGLAGIKFHPPAAQELLLPRSGHAGQAELRYIGAS
jgi:hypothetical protein